MTSSSYDQLKAIILEKSYLSGGDFALASGAGSSFFFDMKPTLLDPLGSKLVAELVLDKLEGLKADAIGGLVLGACPIVSGVCTRSAERSHPIRGFYVRKEAKGRGTQKLIEGSELTSEDNVVMVDDVTTSGGSTLQAIDEVNKIGCKIIKVISIVDREQGAADAFSARGLDFDPLFSRSDIVT